MPANRGYQGRMHLHQKAMMTRYYDDLTKIAETHDGKVACVMIAGSPVELLRAFDIVPVIPEINAVQLAVRRHVLPYLQRAEEEAGYSIDNCAYVKADMGILLNGGVTPFAKIPTPDLVLCNYVGCNVFLHWFEHVADYTGSPYYQLDVPFLRDEAPETYRNDLKYVMKQLEELIELLERISGQKYDEAKLRRIVGYSQETVDYWSRIKHITQRRPAPLDAYFDFVVLMGPLHVLRGTEECRDFFRQAWEEVEEKAAKGDGALQEERFRVVFEGPPPWPYLRAFRDMFTKWGAVGVASTYSTVGGLWEFGFRYDLDRPLESLAEHMLLHNLNSRDLLMRTEQMQRYVTDWDAEAVVIHSVKSCRLFSAGQGDVREYFGREANVPTLLIESDVGDPRYFSEAQIKNRIDAFFESLEHKKLMAVGSKA